MRLLRGCRAIVEGECKCVGDLAFVFFLLKSECDVYTMCTPRTPCTYATSSTYATPTYDVRHVHNHGGTAITMAYNYVILSITAPRRRDGVFRPRVLVRYHGNTFQVMLVKQPPDSPWYIVYRQPDRFAIGDIQHNRSHLFARGVYLTASNWQIHSDNTILSHVSVIP